MKKLIALAIASLLLAACATVGNRPAPYSLEALDAQLMGLLMAERDSPKLAISREQAIQIMPLLQKWKDKDLSASSETETENFIAVQSILTEEQKSYKPKEPEQVQGGQGQGGPGKGGPGPGQGGPGKGGPGPGAGGPGGRPFPEKDKLSEKQRQQKILERLIDRLKAL